MVFRRLRYSSIFFDAFFHNFSLKTCRIKIKVLPLRRQFPPRLFSMRTRVELLLFILLWIIQNNRWIIPKFFKC